MTSVLIIDDQQLVRETIRALVDHEEDMMVCGEASEGKEAIDKCAALHPDILVMDITMPGLNGIEATRQITETFHETKIVAMSVHSSKPFVDAMIKAGASAYVPKYCAYHELATAIREVRMGHVYVSPRIVSDYVHGVGSI